MKKEETTRHICDACGTVSDRTENYASCFKCIQPKWIRDDKSFSKNQSIRENLDESQSPLNTYQDRYSMIMDDDNVDCIELQNSYRSRHDVSRQES